eukprot:ANDGO_02792.mRNA.1 hypothetical protein AMSG_08462
MIPGRPQSAKPAASSPQAHRLSQMSGSTATEHQKFVSQQTRMMHSVPQGSAVAAKDPTESSDNILKRMSSRVAASNASRSMSTADDPLRKDLQKRDYDLMRNTISFQNMSDYSSCKIKPGASFYACLCPRDKNTNDNTSTTNLVSPPTMLPRNVAVRIPNTFVFGLEDNPVWFYTDDNGKVCRQDNINGKKFVKILTSHLSPTADEETLVAVQKKAAFGEGNGNEISMVTLRQVRLLGDNFSSSAGQMVIQQFVKFKGSYASICRVHAIHRGSEKYKTNFAYFVSSTISCTDAKKEPDLRKRFTTVAEEGDMTVSIYRSPGSAVSDIVDVTVACAEAVERSSKQKIASIVCDFVREEGTGLWVWLQCKALELFVRPSSASNSQSLTPKKVSSNSAMSYMGSSASGGSGSDGQLQRDRKYAMCKSCCTYYEPDELIYSMTPKMIYDTEQHLAKRGIYLDWFKKNQTGSSGAPSSDIPLDSSTMYQPCKVCRSCFDLYVTESKLAQVEAEFARAVGIPMQSVESAVADDTQATGSAPFGSPGYSTSPVKNGSRPQSAKPSANGRDSPLGRPMSATTRSNSPALSSNFSGMYGFAKTRQSFRVVSVGERRSSLAVEVENRRRAKMQFLYRFALVLYSVLDVPVDGIFFALSKRQGAATTQDASTKTSSSSATDAAPTTTENGTESSEQLIHSVTDLYLVVSFLDQETIFPVLLPNGFANRLNLKTMHGQNIRFHLPIQKSRVFYWFSETEEACASFLRVKDKIRVELCADVEERRRVVSRKVIASCGLPLSQFVSGMIDRVEHSVFFTLNPDSEFSEPVNAVGTPNTMMTLHAACGMVKKLGMMDTSALTLRSHLARHPAHVANPLAMNINTQIPYIWIPENPATFRTADPLPDEWMASMWPQPNALLTCPNSVFIVSKDSEEIKPESFATPGNSRNLHQSNGGNSNGGTNPGNSPNANSNIPHWLWVMITRRQVGKPVSVAQSVVASTRNSPRSPGKNRGFSSSGSPASPSHSRHSPSQPKPTHSQSPSIESKKVTRSYSDEHLNDSAATAAADIRNEQATRSSTRQALADEENGHAVSAIPVADVRTDDYGDADADADDDGCLSDACSAISSVPETELFPHLATSQLWTICIQVHRISGFTPKGGSAASQPPGGSAPMSLSIPLSNANMHDQWAVRYNLFGVEFRSFENVMFLRMTDDVVFESEDTTFVRCRRDALTKWVREYPDLQIHVLHKTRPIKSGFALVRIADIFDVEASFKTSPNKQHLGARLVNHEAPVTGFKEMGQNLTMHVSVFLLPKDTRIFQNQPFLDIPPGIRIYGSQSPDT